MENIKNKDDISELLKKGTKLYDAEKYAEAIQCFDKALDINPNIEDALILKGICYDKLEEYEEAIECFDIILRFNPKNEDALFNRGKSLYNYGQLPAEIFGGFENKAEVFLEAMQFLDMVLDVNPNFEDAFTYMAKCLDYFSENRFGFGGSSIVKDVLEIFEHRLNLYGDNLKFNHKPEELLYYKGIYYYISFKHKESSEYFEKVLEINPNNEDALIKRAYIYDFDLEMLRGDPYHDNKALLISETEKFLLTCDKLLEINPNNVDGLCLKAYILIFNGKNDEALAIYKKIKKIINNEEELVKIEKRLLVRAENKSRDVFSTFKYNNKIDFYDAYEIYLNLSKINPLNVGIYDGAIEIYKRKIYDFIDNYSINRKKLLRIYEETLKINPHSLEALNGLIRFLKFENAIKSFDKFLKDNPHNSDALISKVEYLASKNKCEDALKSCNDFLKDNPCNVDVLKFKGNLLSKLGRLEESSDVFKEIKNIIGGNQRLCSNLELKIENIGPIHEANLKLGKLNIVGGVNGSGKSTAAKLLFSFLFSASPEAITILFEEYKKYLLNQSSLEKDIKKFFEIKDKPLDKVTEIYKVLKTPLDSIIQPNNFESLIEYVKNYNGIVERYMDEIIKVCNIHDKSKEKFYISMDLIDTDPDINFFMREFFKRELYDQFDEEVNQINSSDINLPYIGKSILSGTLDENLFNWHYIKNEKAKYTIGAELEDSYSSPALTNNVFYMSPISFLGVYEEEKEKKDEEKKKQAEKETKNSEKDKNKFDYEEDKNEFDYISSYDVYQNFKLDFHNVVFLNKIKEFAHKEHKRSSQHKKEDIEFLKMMFGDHENPKCLWCGMELKEEWDICPHCGNNIKLAKIQNTIDEILGGNFEFKPDVNDFVYHKNKQDFRMNQTSSGIQQIGILEMMLRYGDLDENDFLIIDEPELSLHPEWQLKLAEIIVLLVKELGINVYLNSHSPHFIEALEVLSVNYGLRDETRFFMTERYGDSGKYDFYEIGYDNIDELYDNLGNVYDRIENIRIENMMNGL